MESAGADRPNKSPGLGVGAPEAEGDMPTETARRQEERAFRRVLGSGVATGVA